MNIKKWIAQKKVFVIFAIALIFGIMSSVFLIASAETDTSAKGDFSWTVTARRPADIDNKYEDTSVEIDDFIKSRPFSNYDYTTNNENVVIIDSENGKILTVADIDGTGARSSMLPGTAWIRATSKTDPSVYDEMEINVSEPSATAELNVLPFQSVEPNSKFVESDYSDIYSTDSSIADVTHNGTVTSKSRGTCYIYGVDSQTGMICALAKVDVGSAWWQLKPGEQIDLADTVDTTKFSSFESDCEEVATISSDGVITAVFEGSCVISATEQETGESYNLLRLDVRTDTIYLNICEEDNLALHCEMSSFENIASSDSSVVTVDPSGKITAVGAGSARITGTHSATGENGTLIEVEVDTYVFEIYKGYQADLGKYIDFSKYTDIASSDETKVTLDGDVITVIDAAQSEVFTEDQLDSVDWDNYYAAEDYGSGVAGAEYFRYVNITGEIDGQTVVLARIKTVDAQWRDENWGTDYVYIGDDDLRLLSGRAKGDDGWGSVGATISPLVTDVASSDPTVLRVNSDGTIDAVGEGTASIVGKLDGEDIYLGSLEVRMREINLEVGQKYDLVYYRLLDSTELSGIASSATEVASVGSNGVITALAAGKTYITTTDGHKFAVNVTDGAQDVVYLAVGETLDLAELFSDFNYNGKTWNKINGLYGGAAASLDGKVLKGDKEGTLFITPVYETEQIPIYNDENVQIGYKTEEYDSLGNLVRTNQNITNPGSGPATGDADGSNTGDSSGGTAAVLPLRAQVIVYDPEKCEKSVTLSVGQTLDLVGYEIPDDAQRIKLTAADKTIVIADNSGEITGRQIGETVVFAQYDSNKETNRPLLPDVIQYGVGGVYDNINNSPVTMPGNSVTTAAPAGSLAGNNVSEMIAVRVVQGTGDVGRVEATDLMLSNSSLSMTVGGTEQLRAWLVPSNTTDIPNIVWSSSDETVAKVDQDGNVTALGTGTANITAKHGSFEKTCAVTVTADDQSDTGTTVKATGIAISNEKKTVTVGTKFPLSAWLTPNNTTDKINAVWTSSNEKVAKVDKDGNVTGVSTGTAVITVTSGEFSAQCEVSVVKETSDSGGSGSASGSGNGSGSGEGSGGGGKGPTTGDSSAVFAKIMLFVSLSVMLMTLPFMKSGKNKEKRTRQIGGAELLTMNEE